MHSVRSSYESRPTPGKAHQKFYRIFQSWIWEILSIAVAIGLIIAITVLLATYNGKPTPDWGERINLNALLATLSTVLRAMLVVVVSQVISQRKWEWFKITRKRPLSHLQKFDSGSRGIPGAVQLLPIVLWRDPVTFTAALVLITSFLVGPFVQQASRTSECTFVAPGFRASLPFAHYVPRRSGYVSDVERDDLGLPAPDLITAVLSAVTVPDSVENQIRGSCPTGNCTFPNGDPAQSGSGSTTDDEPGRHSTVAMCNKCVDVSSLVTRENVPYPVLSLPNNVSVSRTGGDREVVRLQPSTDLTWMGDLLTPDLRSLSRWAYVNASFIGLNSYANNTAAATMCSLYPCVRTYTTSIDDNNVSQTEVASKVMQLDLLSNDGVTENGGSNALDNVYKYYAAIQSPCRIQEKVFDLNINRSSQINGTNLALFDFTDYGDPDTAGSTWLNVTAPKEPVWKESILPLMFYGRDIVDVKLDQYGRSPCEETPQDQNANAAKEKNPLETKNISKISKSVAVTMPWLQSTDSSGEAPVLRKRTMRAWGSENQREEPSDISLADLEEQEETSSEDFGDHIVPEVLASPQDDWAPRNHFDGNEQTLEERMARDSTRSYQEPGPPQISPISPLEYMYEHLEISEDASERSAGTVEEARARGDQSGVRDEERDNRRIGRSAL
ncbi:hypothetical protein E8E12_000790 [Didymella heteroderae]|uniref:Uncharacterized protein n=1 Tax=Didymella heteroderae TaxID=1769908 RepID=A0A9P4WIU3_9PLEO|nr:hypothetical protein E8E12_000790 [Didymella heteroderae]